MPLERHCTARTSGHRKDGQREEVQLQKVGSRMDAPPSQHSETAAMRGGSALFSGYVRRTESSDHLGLVGLLRMSQTVLGAVECD